MTDFLKLGKGITGALTAAKRISDVEREANLAKFLEDSKTQMRLYHGTTATEGGKEAIRQLKSSKEGALGSGVYLTPQASHASGYSGIPNDEALALMRNSDYGNIDHGKKMADQFMADRAAGTVREGQEGGNMLPVYAQLKNPLVIKAHPDPERYRDPMIEALTQLGMDEKKAVNMVERAYDQQGYIGKQVQSRAQAQGYDGLMQYDRNGDLSEVVSYNPNAIKSAIGNEGTYDTSIPHMGKADGGKIAKGLMGALTKAKELAQAEKPMVNRLDMNFKDVTKRVPELTEAANMLARGEITAAQYDALVTRLKPVTPYSFVPAPATTEDAMRALTENKKPMFGKTGEMSAGEQADLRLDIPAYKDHGVWVNSIHRKDQPTVYGSTSSVKNATMIGAPDKALKVAQGGPKAPFAVIRGDWNPMSEEAAVAKAQEYLDHPDWKQVGYDPERHGYFYDRATMKPVQGAEEVIQIGPLVLAKKPTYGKKSEEKYVDGGKVAKGIVGALTKASNAADAIMAAKKIEAPSIIIPSRISDVKEAVRQSKGDYGARRVERAADEIPNLEKMYKDEALRQAFTGDNAKALMTMNPAKFEKYSEPLDPRFTDADSKRFTTSGEQLTYPKYMEDYLPNVGAFDDVPFLQINKPKQGSPLLPFISGHEGRHRNRVMADRGDEAGLVQLLPSYELREPFPRRSQEEYIEALKEELLMTGNKVRPETIFKSFNFNEPRIKRPPVKLPDIYAQGGGVRHMVDGGKIAKGVMGALAKAREAAQAQKDLRVYHGSPHRMAPAPDNPLGKFDSSRAGTGEGGAAYGVGHYLAQAKDVAKTYRPRSPQHEEKLIKEYNKAQSKSDYPKMEVLEDAMLHKAPDEILSKYSNLDDGYTPEHAKAANDYAQWFEKNKPEVGGLYHVDLPKEHIDNMLDWDKPMKNHPPHIKQKLDDWQWSQIEAEAAKRNMSPYDFEKEVSMTGRLPPSTGGGISGDQYYSSLAEYLGGRDKASKALQEMGIPGIKYYDEASRPMGGWEVGKSADGKWLLKNHELSSNQWKEFPTEQEAISAYNAIPDTGTRNFVVFHGNEDMAKIVDREKKGGVIHMADAGRVGKGIVGALTKAMEIAKAQKAAVVEATPTIEAVVNAADRAAAGRKAADVAKATAPMKMSEALGKMNLEGKGKLRIAQADRTRVGGGNIGGPMFPGLQQVDPSYEGAAWGVGKKGAASAMINDSDANTLWSTLLGSEDQLKSNPMVFNKLRRAFTDSMKQGNLSPELEAKINHNLALTFGEGANIRDPKIWQSADTYEKRGALADLMLGQGIAPGKGGVALGGEKSGKGVIFRPSDILKQETEPMLLHPEHGGDVPTFAVGPRLFSLSGETMTRPDLHPGFPVILKGEDKGVVFSPVAGAEAMPEFVKRYKNVKGREPTGYFDWTKGLKGEGLPSQSITDEYLTYLQKAGKKEGGVMKKPDWHLAVEQKIKDDGYSFVESPKRMSDGGLPDEGAAFGVYRKPKGGEDIRRGGKETGEVFNILGDMVKEQSSKEVESLGKDRASTDLLNRGVLANNPLSVVIDMINMGLVPLDVLGSKLTGRDIKVSSDKPFLGSEYVKDLMNQYGVTSGEERPMMELGLGLLGPNSIIKGAQKTADLAKKAPAAARKVESGLNSLTAQARYPFQPAVLTMEGVAPDLGTFKGSEWQNYLTNKLIGENGAPVNMERMGGRKTEKTMGQGLYENKAGEFESNPMVGVNIPFAGNLSTNKKLLADIGTAGRELNQENVAAHRFVPMMTNQPKDATAMMIKGQGGKPLTKEQILGLADELPGMIVSHSPKAGGMFIAPFKGDNLDYVAAQRAAQEVLGKGAKIQYGKAHPDRDVMYRGDYKDMGARPSSPESIEMRKRLKAMDVNFPRTPSGSPNKPPTSPSSLTSIVR